MADLAAATFSSSSSSSSPRCVPFAFRRGGERRATRGLTPAPGARGPAPAAGCGRPLCRAAEAVGGGIRGAFFASLDGCSCVEVRTKHDDDDSLRMVDAAAPLVRRHGGAGAGAAASGDESAAGRRWRRASGKGNKKQRHGLGCCTANSTTSIN